jgi:predicted transcriptional regulator
VEYKENEQPKVFLLVQALTEEAELVSWQLKSMERGEPGQKRRKTVKRDEVIKKNMEAYDKLNDLYKYLRTFSYINRYE